MTEYIINKKTGKVKAKGTGKKPIGWQTYKKGEIPLTLPWAYKKAKKGLKKGAQTLVDKAKKNLEKRPGATTGPKRKPRRAPKTLRKKMGTRGARKPGSVWT
tara:strand:- start:127 stop:432 length:306 start_codon:yes stop_codon:yes gene_type:complete